MERIIIKVKDRAEENIHIGFYITQFRKNSGVSQYELGKAIGLSEDIAKQQIEKYENCIVRVPIEDPLILITLLNTLFSEFV